MDKALDYVRPGDQLFVTKLDWLARSVRHLIDLVGDLAARGVDLRVLHQGIDTTCAVTPAASVRLAPAGVAGRNASWAERAVSPADRRGDWA